MPLPIYSDERGDKKSVMNHFYYTMEIYIGSYTSEIIGREMLEIAEYHPQLRMEGGIVGDTQCKAIQFVLLAVVVKGRPYFP